MAVRLTNGGAKVKRASILFLKVVIVLVGVGVFVFLLWEPQLEGRNANADQVTIYFRDPFLVYIYLGSLPFFYGLYQAFKLLGYVDRGQAFSPNAHQAVRRIKYCALAVTAFIVGAEAYIMFGVVDDDRAGAVAMGMLAIFVCLLTAAAAVLLERTLQSGVELQSEHDLTV
jgi:hypothetical protein